MDAQIDPDKEARPDRLIAELASRQYGVVAAPQLRALGLTRNQIRRRMEVGRLHPCYRGVYAVGHRALTRHGHWLAAVLACGDGAVLSHFSAAELWRINASKSRGLDRLHRPTDITVPVRSGRLSRAGIILHRRATLPAGDTTTHHRIPSTTPARTIFDLATMLGRRALERVIDEAERLRLCHQEDLEAMVQAHPGRRGAGALRAVLTSHRIGSTATRSELEERFLALCRSHCLPQPEVNVPLLDYVVDFFWPDARLIVEVDGHASHGTRAAFERDRDRDSRLAAHGFTTLRFTWRDVTSRPAVVANRIRRVLRARHG
jgi:very-short-patch-repair endonuclease